MQMKFNVYVTGLRSFCCITECSFSQFVFWVDRFYNLVDVTNTQVGFYIGINGNWIWRGLGLEVVDGGIRDRS